MNLWAILEKLAIVFIVIVFSIEMNEWAPFQRALGGAFPVVDPITVESAVAQTVDDATGVRISAYARKHLNCRRRAVHWYLSDPSGPPIVARFTDKSAENMPGILHWTGLLVGIPPDRLWETYGEVVHSCWGVNVRSRFYVGSRESEPMNFREMR